MNILHARARRTVLCAGLLLVLIAPAAAVTATREQAVAYTESGQFGKAAATYRRLLAADGQDADLWASYAGCLMQDGQWARAARASTKAADLYRASSAQDTDTPTLRADALTQAGEAYLWLNKTKKAWPCFQAAFDIDPTDENILAGIVAACIRSGHTQEADRFCEQNIRANGSKPQVLAPLYLYYAHCRYALGDAHSATGALLVARENYLKAGLTAHDDDWDRLYEQFVTADQ